MGTREISTLHEIKRHGDQGHHWSSHSGDQELVQERTIALVLLPAGEQALVFFSQWHNGCQAQYKKCQHQERRESGSPTAAGGGGCVHEVLKSAQYLALIGGLVKVDGYIRQEEAQDKVVNVQAYGWLQWSSSIRVKVDGKINDTWCWSGRHTHQRKLPNSPPMKSEGRIFSSQHWSNKKVSFHHSNKPICLQRKCKLDACQGALLHGCKGGFTSWLANIWYVCEHVVRKLWYVC